MEGEGEEEAYVGWKNRASSRQHPSSEVENNEEKEAVGSQDLLPSFLFFHAAFGSWLLQVFSSWTASFKMKYFLTF